MNIIRLLPVFLSSLLITAHFLRRGSMVMVLSSLAFPFLLLFTERWAARIVQLCLIAASLEWCRTLVEIARQRIAMEMPWTRLTVILGSVAVLTAASSCVFFLPALKARYKLDKGPGREL